MNLFGQSSTRRTGTRGVAERQPYDPGGPVPMHWGWSRLAVKWIDQPFNQRPLRHELGKGFERISNTVSLVGVLCVGPVDRFHLSVLLNGRHFRLLATGGTGYTQAGTVITRSTGHAVDLQDDVTPSWWGHKQKLRLYWGTVDQPSDPYLNVHRQDASDVPLHPPYQGICYVVFEDWNLDWPADRNSISGTGNLPQLEFFVWRSTPLGGSYDDPSTADDDDIDLGVVPVGPVYDLLTDPVNGVGLGGGLVDSTEWQARWDEMTRIGYHRNWSTRISGINTAPTLAEHQPVEQHLEAMVFPFDGWLRLNDAGRLDLGWRLNRSPSANEFITGTAGVVPTVSSIRVNWDGLIDDDWQLVIGGKVVHNPLRNLGWSTHPSGGVDAPWSETVYPDFAGQWPHGALCQINVVDTHAIKWRTNTCEVVITYSDGSTATIGGLGADVTGDSEGENGDVPDPFAEPEPGDVVGVDVGPWFEEIHPVAAFYLPAGAHRLERGDFVDEPEIEPGSGDTLTDKVTVTFPELASENWNDDEGLMDAVSVTARNPHRRTLQDGETENTSLDVPGVIRRAPAVALAHRVLQQRADPLYRVRGRVLRDAAIKTGGTLLRPGDLTWLDYAPHGTVTLYRVLERREQGTATVDLLLEREPFFAGNVVEEAEDSRVLPTLPAPAALADAEVVDVPPGLIGDGRPRILPLAERGDVYTAGTERYLAFSDFAVSGPEARLADSIFFPIQVTVTAVSTGRVEFGFDDSRGADWLGASFSATDRDLGTVILLLGGEWMGLGAMHLSATGGGYAYRYDYAIQRALFGSLQQSYSIGQRGWLMRRADIDAIQDDDFRTGTEVFLKLVPYGLAESGPETAIISHTIGALVQAPTFTPGEEPQIDGGDILIRVNRPAISDSILVQVFTSDTDLGGDPPVKARVEYVEKGSELRIPIDQPKWYWVSVHNQFRGQLSPPMDNLDGDPDTEGWWIDATAYVPPPERAHIMDTDFGGKARSGDQARLWDGVTEMQAAVDAATGPFESNDHPIITYGRYEMRVRIVPHATFPHDGYYVGWWDAGATASKADDGQSGGVWVPAATGQVQVKLIFPRAGWYYVQVQATRNRVWSPANDGPQGWVYTDVGVTTAIEDAIDRIEALEGA